MSPAISPAAPLQPVSSSSSPTRPLDSPLTPAEREQLARAEIEIRLAITKYVKCAAALEAIRAGGLWRSEHASFAAYCLDRWDLEPAEDLSAVRVVRPKRPVAPPKRHGCGGNRNPWGRAGKPVQV